VLFSVGEIRLVPPKNSIADDLKSYDCPSLCKKSWSLILMNFTDICRFEDFTYLDKEDLVKIITVPE
jgi:hypothetical protein